MEWDALLQRDPGELAVALPDESATVAELEAAARAMAGTLLDSGVEPGDRVIVALPNGVRFVAAYLATRLCGAVFVNAPWQWRRELVAVAEETRARCILLPAAVAGDESLRTLADRVLTGEPGARRATAAAPMPRADGDDAWIAYSSGTTGAPKGAVHTERTLGLIPEGFIDRYALGPGDPILVAAAAGHAIGFIYGVQLALRTGAPMVLLPRWDPEVAAALAERHGCRWTAAPTPLLIDAVAHAERAGRDAFASLRFFLCGGAAVPAALLARAREVMPATETSAYFGTSETGAVTSCPPGTPMDKVLSTDGVPLPTMEVALGERDELLVRGAQTARGYYGADVAGRFRADGWYATGDRATIDGDGFIRLTGRVHDLIRRGGVDVAPGEVEEALAAHPAVREAAVFALEDARLGARVAAAVVASGAPPSLDDLREHCRGEGLAKVKWPERLVLVPELPRLPSGKLRRSALDRLIGR
ncbi:MAG: cyclohexanecarboxylate-CoA ligase [Solirubrobacteraceae bacterium]|nr:cyclohexanecarboxylate-CoA ligase [Solirubrobacteraceae bacterium]